MNLDYATASRFADLAGDLRELAKDVGSVGVTEKIHSAEWENILQQMRWIVDGFDDLETSYEMCCSDLLEASEDEGQ